MSIDSAKQKDIGGQFGTAKTQPPLQEDLDIITLQNTAEHRQLLERVYNEIYLPAFPMEDEQEDLNFFLEGLKQDSDQYQDAFIVVGRGLDNPETADLAGMNQGWYLKNSSTAVGFYLAVSPEHQGQTFGRKLINKLLNSFDMIAKEHGEELNGTFCEVNDPSVVSAEEDSMDPYRRMQYYHLLGGKQAPIDYTQPATPGVPEYDELILMAAPKSDGSYPDKEAIQGFLYDYYSTSPNYDYDASNSEAYLRMKKEVDALEYKVPYETLPIRPPKQAAQVEHENHHDMA